MTKQRNQQAYKIFKRIAVSNKKNLDELTELSELKRMGSSAVDAADLNSVRPIKTDEETTAAAAATTNDEMDEKKLSALDTVRIFFKSRRLLARSIVVLVNWLTNTLVYYGISFNTGELAGSPYLNFTLSVLLELLAILVSHYAFDKFGRKIPYAINMSLSGIALLFVLFVPTSKKKKFF